MGKFILYIFLSFFLFLCTNIHAQPHEQILNFDSYIIVNKNASVDITETITAHTNQDRILRGIVRRLPIRYRDTYGMKHHVNYFIQQVLLDQKPSTYHTEYSNNQYAIYIGKLDTLLAPGDYTYTIRYHVNNAINFLQDGDELYWNVTGNEWDFPILKTSATILFPKEATISHYAAYTGKTGAKDQNFIATQLAANKIQFTATSTFNPGEGLTIALVLPKGFIIEPTWKEKVKSNFAIDYTNYIAFTITAFIFIYMLTVWYFRRHPKKNIITPISEPPLNLSAGAMRYIMNMKADAKTFTAAIVSMATKNALRIENQEDTCTLLKQTQTVELPYEEKNLFENLFKNNSSLQLTTANAQTIQSAEINFFISLKKQFNEIYFHNTFAYLIPAFLLSLIALIISISTYSSTIIKNLILLLTFGIITSIFIYLITTAWQPIRNAIFNSSKLNILTAIRSSFVTLLFAGAILFGLIKISIDNSTFTIALLFILLVLNITFQKILKSYTPAGNKVMNQIEGFKLFLTNSKHHPDDASAKDAKDLFEKYLPYVIALDIEDQWGEKLDNMLKTAETEASHYQPYWYSGKPWPGMNAIMLSNFLNSVLNTSSLSSITSTASDGQGSSGGGNAGGGGGGW